MERKFVNIEDLQKMYEELFPWDKVEFCEWIKTRREFEMDPDCTEIPLTDILDCHTEEEILDMCDHNSIVDYVLDHGLEEMVVDAYDGKSLAEYLEMTGHEALSHIRTEE